MSIWINVDVYPAKRRMVVILARRNLQPMTLLNMIERVGPKKFADTIGELIVEKRPELSGLLIEAIQYDVRSAEWIISAAHPSFDEVGTVIVANEEFRRKHALP